MFSLISKAGFTISGSQIKVRNPKGVEADQEDLESQQNAKKAAVQNKVEELRKKLKTKGKRPRPIEESNEDDVHKSSSPKESSAEPVSK